MTVTILNTIPGRSNHNSVQGKSRADEICVNVQWPWIAMPAIFMGLGLGFYVATTVITRKDRIWKNSVIGILQMALVESINTYPEYDVHRRATA
jgi:hypothetical protein